MAIDIGQFSNKALEAPIKLRDYRLELLASAPQLPDEYSIDFKGQIKNQGQSSSCVAQALSYYAEVLNWKETGTWTSLSARYLYSKIYQPQGGAYINDGLSILQNEGIALDSDVLSTENGLPPSENYMRKGDDITPAENDTAKQFLIKKYLTWDNNNVEWYKQAIMQGSGCVAISWGNNSVWSLADIILPSYRSQMVWQHCIYFMGWSEKKQAFKILNSWNGWGDNGEGWLPYSYVTNGYLTNPKTMVDAENTFYISQLSILKNLLEKLVALFKSKK